MLSLKTTAAAATATATTETAITTAGAAPIRCFINNKGEGTELTA